MSWGYVCSTAKEQNFGYDNKIMTAAEVIWIIGLLIIAYFSFQKNNFTIWTLDLQVPSTWAPEVESSSFMPSCTHLYGSCSKHSWLASSSASPVNTGSFAYESSTGCCVWNFHHPHHSFTIPACSCESDIHSVWQTLGSLVGCELEFARVFPTAGGSLWDPMIECSQQLVAVSESLIPIARVFPATGGRVSD